MGNMCEHCGSSSDVAEVYDSHEQLCLLCLLDRGSEPLDYDFYDDREDY